MTATTIGPPTRPSADVAVLVGAAGAAVVVGALSVVVGLALPVVLVVGAVFVLVAARPVAAAYLFLAALPFVTGISRGSLVELLRPNEALQGFLTVAVVAGLLVRFVRGETLRIRVTRLDRAMVALAVLASAWPIAWELARSQTPTSSDLMSTVPLWRFVALYALFRVAVRERTQIRRCLWILLAGAGVLAVIATLEALGLLTLGSLWTPDASTGSQGRGNATLSSAIAVGDYLACSLAVALAWIFRLSPRRALLYPMVAVLVLGSLGAGQFSAWLGAILVAVLVAAREGRLRRMLVRGVPVILVGLALTWPIVGRRLGGFGSDLGVPSSWAGRVDNVTTFYLPALGGFRWVLGVRPDSVLPAPETWREVIYLESGLLWFLWVGGVPLLLAALWFVRVALGHARRIASSGSGELGVVGLATWAALWMFALLSVIDMHLTLRGAGDLLFILLGLSAVRLADPSDPPGAGPTGRPAVMRLVPRGAP